MKELTVLLDMDEVLIDLLAEWIRCVNALSGTSVQPEDIVSWNIEKFFPTLTTSQVMIPLTKGYIWELIKPKAGAVEYVKKLKEDGHRVLIVTNSHYKGLSKKMRYALFKNFPYISWNDVIVTCHKQLIKGDVLIDDGIHNLVGGDYKKILMDSTHNRNYPAEESGMIRVKNWEEAYNAVKAIAETEESDGKQ